MPSTRTREEKALLVLAAGVFALYLCPLYAAIYVAGIVLVHAPAGWFVVGLGRNGMEYSVLLVVCLLCIAYQHFPDRKAEGSSRHISCYG